MTMIIYLVVLSLATICAVLKSIDPQSRSGIWACSLLVLLVGSAVVITLSDYTHIKILQTEIGLQDRHMTRPYGREG